MDIERGFLLVVVCVLGGIDNILNCSINDIFHADFDLGTVQMLSVYFSDLNLRDR